MAIRTDHFAWGRLMALGAFACGIPACGDSAEGTTITTSSSLSGASSSSGGPGGGGAGGSADQALTAIVSQPAASTVSESEPAIAVSNDGSEVAVAWIGTLSSGATIGYSISTDRGVTWSVPANVPTPPGRSAFDPSLVASANGGFYLAWADVQGGVKGHVNVAEALVGSTAFNAPVVVHESDNSTFYDRPSINITQSGEVLVAYAREVVAAAPPDSTLFVSRSQNGSDWTETVALDSTSFIDFARPCVAQDGGQRVYLSFLGATGVSLLWSDDQGATWPAANSTAGVSGSDGVGTQPSCAASGDDVWLSYGVTTETFSDTTGVTLSSANIAHSSDRGHSFAKSLVLTDPAGARLMVPELGVDAGGRLAIVYYNGAAKEDPAAAFRFRTSLDKGSTWAPSAVAFEPLLMTVSRASKAWLGDYEGIAVHDQRVWTAFADNSVGGTSHIRFYRSPVQP